MALNETLYRELLYSGISHHAALRLADPDKDTISAAAVADPVAVTSTDAAGATPTKAEFDALRADLVATRATLTDLLESLRDGGIVSST